MFISITPAPPVLPAIAIGLIAGSSRINGAVTATGGDWSNYKQIKVGELRLEPGTQRITLRPDGDVRGALIDLRTIALVPSGQIPRFAKTSSASSSEVLRDAASVARFILDPNRSQSARETAVQANPQFASALIVEMTRDLPPGKEEYVRIPWIWRVAIACGRRNDAGQIRSMLDVSLPKIRSAFARLAGSRDRWRNYQRHQRTIDCARCTHS